MPFHITSEEKADYLQINTTGMLGNLEELRAHSNETYEEIAKYKKSRILLRNNEMDYILDLVPYYELVSFYSEDFPIEVRTLKIALLIAPQYLEIGKFWENLCVNRGYNFFCFISEKEAIDWLIND